MPHVSRSLRDNEPPETRPEFLEHLRALQLGSVEVYRQWCQRHGFSRRIHKTWRERLKERTFFQRATADARLAQKKLETRNPDKVIQAIYQGRVSESDVTQGPLAEICRASERYQDRAEARDRLFELLLHVRRKSDLFAAAPVIAQFGRQPGNSYVAALIALAGHWQAWIRPISQWRPRTHNLRRQFTSLVHHLLARWPVPQFMDCAWVRDEAEAAQRQQQWYLHLARGENIRTAELPLPYTKRMAHHFLQAPADFTIEAALRWVRSGRWAATSDSRGP
jgi:hypothetical protein